MDILTDSAYNWILSVGVFLPLLGVLAMMFVPNSDEVLIKGIGIVTAGATLAVGIATLILFDYDKSGELQFFVDAEWIEVINSRYIVGHGLFRRQTSDAVMEVVKGAIGQWGAPSRHRSPGRLGGAERPIAAPSKPTTGRIA